MVRPEIAAGLMRAIHLEHQGQLKEAERLLFQIIRDLQKEGNSIGLSVAHNNLGVLYATTERFAEAERHFLRGLRGLEAIPGKRPELDIAKIKIRLASMYIEAGRGKEIERLGIEDIIANVSCPEEAARAKNIIAAHAMSRKDMVTAERLYLQLLDFWMEPKRVDAGQLDIATILNNLGVIALSHGQVELARKRLDQSFAAWQRVDGPRSPNAVKAMGNVGVICMELKKYDEAAMWLSRAIEVGRDTFGELHPLMVNTQRTLAEALKKAGRKTEARDVARAADEARRMMIKPTAMGYTVDYRQMADPKDR